MVKLGRSAHTARAYANAARIFRLVLKKNGLDPAATSSDLLKEDAIAWLVKHLKDLSPATERLYVQAVTGFYQYVDAERLADVNLSRLKLLIRQRARRPGIRLPQFPADEIARVLNFVQSDSLLKTKKEPGRLRALRDRAFLLTLADTGLRVHEACKLRRGDVDWNEGRAVIVGKGDKQAVVRFSERALRALKGYLDARVPLDGSTGRPLASLPLFARHDKGAGSKIKPITTATGRNIVHERVREALGESASGRITPHSLRHYFVTTVLRASGNLKMAQELARHTSIQVTQRYAHLSNDELDRGYHEIFNRVAKKNREEDPP
jgi:integrase